MKKVLLGGVLALLAMVNVAQGGRRREQGAAAGITGVWG